MQNEDDVNHFSVSFGPHGLLFSGGGLCFQFHPFNSLPVWAYIGASERLFRNLLTVRSCFLNLCILKFKLKVKSVLEGEINRLGISDAETPVYDVMALVGTSVISLKVYAVHLGLREHILHFQA